MGLARWVYNLITVSLQSNTLIMMLINNVKTCLITCNNKESCFHKRGVTDKATLFATFAEAQKDSFPFW